VVEVGGGDEEANISRASGVVEDQVVGFNGDAVAGGNKVGPGVEGRTDDMESVTDVGAEGGFTQLAAAKEVVTKRVKGGMAARARETSELGGEAGKAEFAWGGQEVLGVAVGESVECKSGRDTAGERGEVGGNRRWVRVRVRQTHTSRG
jgi:hypothetical protein